MDDKTNKPTERNPPAPVVAIGVSAGGLEQISLLLGAMPVDTGAAFVILQHLDPHRASQLPELLDRATGIILSGTGSDGALGLKAIRAAGGLTLVQNPEDAEYPGMPQAAARETSADYVLDTNAMAHTLGNHLRLNLPNLRAAGCAAIF